jgi:UTP--glucose-1-phosphate uridylyltransferase
MPSNDTPSAAAAAERLSKLVVPTAGLGTRFLPATKAVPKELLPVVDRPALEYVIEEAVATGLHDVLLVTGKGKRAVEDHFDVAEELERALEAKGDHERLAMVRRSSEMATVHSVRQGVPRGLGHAVLCAAEHVGDEPFVVSLPDVLLDGGADLLLRMAAVRARHGGSVVAVYEVPGDEVEKYGVAAVDPVAGEDTDVVRVTDLVEKPARADAPSNLALLGRYLLDPAVFEVLRKTEPGRGGEIQLTDAIQELAASGVGGPVHAVVFRDRVFDTGDKLEYLKAVVRLAARRDDLGPAFTSWLHEFVAGRDGS